MRHITKDDTRCMEPDYRAHLINSLLGVKSANLIGTNSQQNQTIFAIFSYAKPNQLQQKLNLDGSDAYVA
ncbi:hypothetical protein [Thalassotalea atypica]|uniref:hypothetical protein n=1 Tax=Thalassotalea atypica TaxID=2054316 RepID=UPI002573EE85|nr:hypothetical protein [Thalassotalea atypica]